MALLGCRSFMPSPRYIGCCQTIGLVLDHLLPQAIRCCSQDVDANVQLSGTWQY
jgi:hypothetical protein